MCRLRLALLGIALSIGTSVELQAQMSAKPDTGTQVQQAGDTLRLVQWAVPVTPRLLQVMAHNRSDAPLAVRGYQLSGCSGTRNPDCGYHLVQVVIPAHGTTILGQVATRRDIRGGYRYHLRLDATNPPTPS